jgi:hypothetical protein
VAIISAVALSYFGRLDIQSFGITLMLSSLISFAVVFIITGIVLFFSFYSRNFDKLSKLFLWGKKNKMTNTVSKLSLSKKYETNYYHVENKLNNKVSFFLGSKGKFD